MLEVFTTSTRNQRLPLWRRRTRASKDRRRLSIGHRSRSIRQKRGRSGFTLFEVMLVLGILLAFAGLTLPPVMRMYGQRKLTESAERVRAVAASARVRAIDSGLVYQFCCEANGRNFVAVPFEPDHYGGTSGQQGSGGQAAPVTRASRVWGQLPNGIVFRSVVIGTSPHSTMTTATGIANPSTMTMTMVTGGTQKIAPSSLEGLPNAGALAGLDWSTPILYNADGSANTDARIVVGDTKSQQITLHVRAFTGAVSMDRLVVGKR